MIPELFQLRGAIPEHCSALLQFIAVPCQSQGWREYIFDIDKFEK